MHDLIQITEDTIYLLGKQNVKKNKNLNIAKTNFRFFSFAGDEIQGHMT